VRSSPPPLFLAWSVWGVGAALYLIGFFQRVAPAVMTDRLMTDFAIGGAALGNLSALYFYTYVAMQIPTGILADRWGPRKLLIGGAATASLGTLLFALSADFFWAGLGRLLIGASVAVAFVANLKLASHWFDPRQYATASGMALLVGISGGVVAGVPLRLAVDAYGWRPVMLVAAGVTALLAGVAWRWVRNDPAEAGYASHFHGQHHGERASVWHELAEVLARRDIWLLTLIPIGYSGGVLTFAGLWGVPWLRQVHGLDAKSAAMVTSVMLIAWAAGGPLLGSWSTRFGKRKPLYLISGAIALAGWAAAIFLPLTLPLLVPVLAVTGFFCGNIIIGFAWAKESVPLRLMGTASGVANMGPLMGGMFLQPAVGWVLDRHWQGTLVDGARVYDAAAYESGFMLIFTTVAGAFALVWLVRESHCRQSG